MPTESAFSQKVRKVLAHLRKAVEMTFVAGADFPAWSPSASELLHGAVVRAGGASFCGSRAVGVDPFFPFCVQTVVSYNCRFQFKTCLPSRCECSGPMVSERFFMVIWRGFAKLFS